MTRSITLLLALTALGRWQSGATQLGYRDHGNGRFFALEADWQDSENYWKAASTNLMRALISW